MENETIETAARAAWELSCRRPMPFESAVTIMADRYHVSASDIHRAAFQMHMAYAASDPSYAENI